MAYPSTRPAFAAAPKWQPGIACPYHANRTSALHHRTSQLKRRRSCTPAMVAASVHA
jgi:hypothetical protein